MSLPARPASGRTRWPLLAVGVALVALLAGTVALERAAPRAASSAPAVAPLPPLVLADPMRCTQADGAGYDGESAGELPLDGRLTSTLAIRCPRLFDGRMATYVGEVVGDILRRDGGAWAMVNDDAYALELGPVGVHRDLRGFNTGLAVWLPDGLHEQLGPPGRHGRRGDVISVEGTVLRADPADGGGLTLRATTLTILAPSVAVEEPLDPLLAMVAAISASCALAATLWKRRRRRRLRDS
jgi:hypothetical protein